MEATIEENPALSEATEMLEVARHLVVFANSLATQRTAWQHAGATQAAQALSLSQDEQRLRSYADWLTLHAAQSVVPQVPESQERLLRTIADAESSLRDSRDVGATLSLVAALIGLAAAIVEAHPERIVEALARLRKPGAQGLPEHA